MELSGICCSSSMEYSIYNEEICVQGEGDGTACAVDNQLLNRMLVKCSDWLTAAHAISFPYPCVEISELKFVEMKTTTHMLDSTHSKECLNPLSIQVKWQLRREITKSDKRLGGENRRNLKNKDNKCWKTKWLDKKGQQGDNKEKRKYKMYLDKQK